MGADRYGPLCLAVKELVRSEGAPLVAAGRAEVHLATDDRHHELKPLNPAACRVSVYLQTEHEVSLWPVAPGTDRAPTVDIWDDDPHELLSYLEEYLAAIVEGRVELTLRAGSSEGRCRFWLSDGNCQTHYYNVFLGFLVGRGSGWETFRPDPY